MRDKVQSRGLRIDYPRDFEGSRKIRKKIILFLFVLFLVWFAKGAVDKEEEEAKIRLTRLTMAEIEYAVQEFRMYYNRCPKKIEELVYPPGELRYLHYIPQDAWGERFIFRCPGKRRAYSGDIISKGPDRSMMGDDNIKRY
jgi:hypothetical protein